MGTCCAQGPKQTGNHPLFQTPFTNATPSNWSSATGRSGKKTTGRVGCIVRTGGEGGIAETVVGGANAFGAGALAELV